MGNYPKFYLEFWDCSSKQFHNKCTVTASKTVHKFMNKYHVEQCRVSMETILLLSPQSGQTSSSRLRTLPMGCGASQDLPDLPDWSLGIAGDVRSGYDSVMQIVGEEWI